MAQEHVVVHPAVWQHLGISSRENPTTRNVTSDDHRPAAYGAEHQYQVVGNLPDFEPALIGSVEELIDFVTTTAS